jgi:SAM-dependent methyltransferase
MGSGIDFGYPWFLSYGHLLLALVFAGLWWLGRARRWPVAPMVLIGALLLWSVAAFGVARIKLNLNGLGELPTEGFLTAGAPRVLDMGAGTGRSAIMVLQARPRATLVALDLFGESYERHFGKTQSAEERLMSNLRAAGVAERATVVKGDVRKLPFEAESFDGIVSAYVLDHLNREGITLSVREANRVLKPQGEFLLMLIGKEPWVSFAFGPLLMHGGTRGAEWWSGQLTGAGFQVTEHGMRPGTLFLLARKVTSKAD